MQQLGLSAQLRLLERGWQHRIVGHLLHQRRLPGPHQGGETVADRQLFTADVIVLLAGQPADGGRVAQDHRAHEHHQVALHLHGLVVTEQPPQHRNVPQQRHPLLANIHLVIDQTAQHQDLAALHHHAGLDGALVGIGPQLGVLGNAGDLLLDLQLDGASLVDLRPHLELQAHILPFDGLERVGGSGGGARGGEGTGDEGAVLSHHDLRLLVVHGDDVRGGEHVGAAVRGQGPQQRTEIGTRPADVPHHHRQTAAQGQPLAGLGRSDIAGKAAETTEVDGTDGRQAGAASSVGAIHEPLHAQFPLVVQGDLGDDGLHQYLGAGDVQFGDHRLQGAELIGWRSDDQGVGPLVRLDAHIAHHRPASRRSRRDHLAPFAIRSLSPASGLLRRLLLRLTDPHQHLRQLGRLGVAEIDHLGIAAAHLDRGIQLGDDAPHA